ncbi:hypothetical protein JWG42_17080 [Desulfoprunum benzoelyticum]|uniref:Uncharacterized protein n=1 Tax=Desulfoprunum benzoelyticum TaxID=1506996 RepID=A0A840V3V5_9BACT|nr:hypothetical protein [Desulfoprunum benzoelyticum]MBB5349478.1 hypothetical protein [Desulfoprunum benzoelyticum]MBM9531869.1 hypothetical protein [Desulfoprunum benzoelyticum]
MLAVDGNGKELVKLRGQGKGTGVIIRRRGRACPHTGPDRQQFYQAAQAFGDHAVIIGKKNAGPLCAPWVAWTLTPIPDFTPRTEAVSL